MILFQLVLRKVTDVKTRALYHGDQRQKMASIKYAHPGCMTSGLCQWVKRRHPSQRFYNARLFLLRISRTFQVPDQERIYLHAYFVVYIYFMACFLNFVLSFLCP